MPLSYRSFLLLSWFYVWLRVDPRLLYFRPSFAFPPFSLDAASLRAALACPGGPSSYASAFLSQLFFYSWAGALVIAVVSVSLMVFTGAFLASLTGGRPCGAHFVPGLLLVLLYDRYIHALGLGVSLVVAVALASAYVRIPSRNVVLRCAWFLALAAGLYYAAGGAVFVFAALCGVYEIGSARRLPLGLACAAAAAALPYLVGVVALDLRPSDAYWCFLPYHLDTAPEGSALLLAFYASVPVLAVVLAILGRRGEGQLRAPGGPVSRLREGVCRIPYASVAVRAALFAGAAFVIWVSFDARIARKLRADYLNRQQMWQPLLTEVHRMNVGEEYGSLTNCAVNRALCREGRLLDEMFNYPQQPNGLLLSRDQREGEVLGMPVALMQLSDAYWDLGLVNDSEHMAQEVLEHLGARPWILERLALAQAVKGRNEARRAFLHALSRDLVYGGQAARALSSGGLEAQDQEVQRCKALMVRQDAAGALTTEEMLLHLLQTNSRNRMAFDYLIAHYLLTKRLDRVAENIGRLGDLGYSRIPRHCEEALLLRMRETGKQADLHGLVISSETVERFAELSRIMDRYGADRRAAAQEAFARLRHTYFFYYLFIPMKEPA